MAASTLPTLKPTDVHATLARHILADGFDIVFDFEKSHGSWVFDSRREQEFLDFLSFFASCPVGYNHPGMREPEFLRRLLQVSVVKPTLSDIYTLEFARFVELLERQAIPSHMPHAFFVEGGAVGIENALKTAFDWKVRKNKARGVPGERGTQVIHFREAFHGRTGYTLSLTNTDPVKTDYYPKFRWPRIDNPKLRFPLTGEVERDVRAAEERSLDQIKRAFEDNPDDIAAIIIEPIQAEGGDNHFRAEFLQALERIANDNECFFIVDEVQAGVGLTGKMWAYEHYGVKPDALAFGKKSQVSGCFVGPKVDEVQDNVFQISSRLNSTWGGGLADMLRWGRYLEIMQAERLIDNAAAVGEHLLRGLRGLEAELGGVVSNARGRGLMIAFDLPTPELRSKALARLFENRLLLLGCGPRSIRFRPPLNLSRAEADAGLEIIRKSLKSL